jgi:hypothetical protein
MCASSHLKQDQTRASHTDRVPRRFEEALQLALSDEAELIALDSQHLQSHHLAQLLQALQRKGGASALAVLSLEGNLLTDESCALLRDALQDAAFCPSLLTVNLNGNAGITPLGVESLRESLAERPDLKARPRPRATGCTALWQCRMYSRCSASSAVTRHV